jgi:hypothetical protein
VAMTTTPNAVDTIGALGKFILGSHNARQNFEQIKST